MKKRQLRYKVLAWGMIAALTSMNILPNVGVVAADTSEVAKTETQEPKAEEPKTEEPKTEEPKTEEPKVEESKTGEPKVEGNQEEFAKDEKAEMAIDGIGGMQIASFATPRAVDTLYIDLTDDRTTVGVDENKTIIKPELEFGEEIGAFVSGDSETATVTSDTGIVKAVKSGKTTITVTVTNPSGDTREIAYPVVVREVIDVRTTINWSDLIKVEDGTVNKKVKGLFTVVGGSVTAEFEATFNTTSVGTSKELKINDVPETVTTTAVGKRSQDYTFRNYSDYSIPVGGTILPKITNDNILEMIKAGIPEESSWEIIDGKLYGKAGSEEKLKIDVPSEMESYYGNVEVAINGTAIDATNTGIDMQAFVISQEILISIQLKNDSLGYASNIISDYKINTYEVIDVDTTTDVDWSDLVKVADGTSNKLITGVFTVGGEKTLTAKFNAQYDDDKVGDRELTLSADDPIELVFPSGKTASDYRIINRGGIKVIGGEIKPQIDNEILEKLAHTETNATVINGEDGLLYVGVAAGATGTIKLTPTGDLADKYNEVHLITDGNDTNATTTGIEIANSPEDRIISGKIQLVDTDTKVKSNISEELQVIYVDAKAPTMTFTDWNEGSAEIEAGIRNITFGYFSKQSTYSIGVSDVVDGNGSGVETRSYYVWEGITADTQITSDKVKAKTQEALTWTALAGTSAASIEAKDDYSVVLVKVADKVGNTTIYASNGIVVDMEPPTVSIIPESTLAEEEINYTIEVKDEVGSAGLGYLQLDFENGSNKVSKYVSVASGNKEYTTLEALKAEDIMYQTDKKFTIAEMSKDLSISKKLTASIFPAGTFEESLPIKITATLCDRVGNISATHEAGELYLDTKKSNVVLGYVNNSVLNEKYFKDGRTLELSITEQHVHLNTEGKFDSSYVKGMIKVGDPVTDTINLSDLKWEKDSTEENKYNASYMTQGDGIYKVENIGFVDKTGIITELADVQYKEGTEAALDFVVDSTDPKIGVKYFAIEEDDQGKEVKTEIADIKQQYFSTAILAEFTLTDVNFSKDETKFGDGPSEDDSSQIDFKISETGSVEDPIFETLNTYAEARENWKKQEGTDNTYTMELRFDQIANYTLDFTYADLGGRQIKGVPTEFSYDDVAPVITGISYDKEKLNTKYFNDEAVQATITVKERHFDQDNTKVIIENLQGGEPVVPSWKVNTEGLSDEAVSTCVIDFIEEGDYKVTINTTDKAGNHAATHIEEFTIDRTAPEVSSIRYLNKVTGEDITEDILNGKQYKQDAIRAKIQITEDNFGLTDSFGQSGIAGMSTQMKFGIAADKVVKKDAEGKPVPDENPTIANDLNTQANDRKNWNTAIEKSNTYEITLDFDVVANYTLDFDYTDLAGNKLEEKTTAVTMPQQFTYDDVVPTGTMKASGYDTIWTELFHTITFGIFEQSTVTVDMTSADYTAGVVATSYYKYYPHEESRNSFTGLTAVDLDNLSESVWNAGSQAFNIKINPNEQVVVYQRILDKAGNLTYINNETGIVVDNVAPDVPKITINLPEPAQQIYNQNVPFTIQVSDPTVNESYAGLKSVSYVIEKDGEETQSGDYNESLEPASKRVENLEGSGTVVATENNSNNVVIRVTATDNAGNTVTEEKQLSIDITAPTVQITYDNNSPANEKYYKDTRTATVTVTERNFDPNAVRFNITNTDGTQPSISGWSIGGNGGSDSDINTCTVSFAAEGDYTMTMNTTDKAGNDSNYTQVDEFTVDKTLPEINVSYNNNNASEPGYYNQTRTATITINEHNFSASDVEATITAQLQGQGVSAPSIGGWSQSGDNNTATVSYTSEADYTFDISCIDLATNQATDYTQEEFTVDLTKPTVEILDIVDLSANNGVVAPTVNFSDVNYNGEKVTLTLEGSNRGNVEVDVEPVTITNGQEFQFADFEKEQEIDDIYTLTATAYDRAGNTDEKTVKFSVNRFGSTYEIVGEETKTLLDNYYANEERDVVVREVNVDILEESAVSYGRDGESVTLEKDRDYTVRNGATAAQWSEYVYTIAKENFETEGNYVVTVESTDKATNESNNKVKKMDVEFAIDKTAPTLVVSGIEDAAQYNEDSREITVVAQDNLAINNMDIYIDGTLAEDGSYTSEELVDSNGEVSYTISSNNAFQNVKVIATDMAGNEAESSPMSVLVTSNLFVQYYSNTPLLVGSILGVLVLCTVLYFAVIRKRKRQ